MNPATDVLLDPYTYKGLLALHDMKAPGCFLRAGLSLLLVSSIHFSLCLFGFFLGGWGSCLLACLFLLPI